MKQLLDSKREANLQARGLNPVPSRPVTTNEQHPVTANDQQGSYTLDAKTSRTARRIALDATERIDQLSLVGYPSLDPAYRAVVEEAVFYAARNGIEA